jgi:serine phosphatase RsbU (regulator of sigma subunit)
MRTAKIFFHYIFFFVLFLLAFQIIQELYPKLHPLPQTDFLVKREQAESIAKEFLNKEIPDADLDITTSFIIDKDLFRLGNDQTDQTEPPPIVKEKYWELKMISRKNKKTSLTFSSNSDDTIKRSTETEDLYIVRIASSGVILKLDFEKPRRFLYRDSLSFKSKSPAGEIEISMYTKAKAYLFLKSIGIDTTQLELVSSEGKQDSLGTIINYTYREQNKKPFIRHEIKLSPEGIIFFYEYHQEIQSVQTADKNNNSFTSILFIIIESAIYLILIFFLVYFLIRFYKKETISLTIGLPFVYLIASTTFFQTIFTLWNSSFLVMIMGIVFTTIIYSGGFLLIYAVSDSLARQHWSNKLTVTDQILQGKFLTIETGKAIYRGIFLGVVSLSFYVFTLYISHLYLNSKLTIDENLEYSFTIIFPVLTFTLATIYKAVYNEFFFRLFGLSVAKKWLKKNYLIILIGIIFAVVITPELKSENKLLQFFIMSVPAFLFTYFFVRFEIATTIIGYFTYHILSKAVVYSHTTEPFFKEFGVGLYLVLAGIVLIGALPLLFRKKEQEIIQPLVPDYIRRKEEKERLLRELEIARNVQQKFLPSTTPRIENYDIAAHCQPAWEVGGDYFDYFPITKDQLGIVIGDVSNKGVSAAFYMTMVKGFLKALASHHTSPAELLCEVNTLFYDNVERGHFVSLIYGNLNIKTGEFTFSRAGHNPVLLLFGKSKRGKWFTPKGVGVGILPESKFRSTISEKQIQLNADDILILYTDGYPEAMNENKQEYGEENLLHLIEIHKNLSAEDIIQQLEKSIKLWEGNQSALDDRTVIVIKRLS